jgi:hypothetical protein
LELGDGDAGCIQQAPGDHSLSPKQFLESSSGIAMGAVAAILAGFILLFAQRRTCSTADSDFDLLIEDPPGARRPPSPLAPWPRHIPSRSFESVSRRPRREMAMSFFRSLGGPPKPPDLTPDQMLLSAAAKGDLPSFFAALERGASLEASDSVRVARSQ